MRDLWMRFQSPGRNGSTRNTKSRTDTSALTEPCKYLLFLLRLHHFHELLLLSQALHLERLRVHQRRRSEVFCRALLACARARARCSGRRRAASASIEPACAGRCWHAQRGAGESTFALDVGVQLEFTLLQVLGPLLILLLQVVQQLRLGSSAHG